MAKGSTYPLFLLGVNKHDSERENGKGNEYPINGKTTQRKERHSKRCQRRKAGKARKRGVDQWERTSSSFASSLPSLLRRFFLSLVGVREEELLGLGSVAFYNGSPMQGCLKGEAGLKVQEWCARKARVAGMRIEEEQELKGNLARVGRLSP